MKPDTRSAQEIARALEQEVVDFPHVALCQDYGSDTAASAKDAPLNEKRPSESQERLNHMISGASTAIHA